MKALMLAGTALAALGASAANAQATTQSAPAAAASQATAAVPNNILLADWTGPYAGVPPFDKVSPGLFPQAIQFAIDEQKREALAIANNPAAPTFANTVEALEKTGERLDRVLSVFGVMTSNMANDEYQALDKEWSPKLSAA